MRINPAPISPISSSERGGEEIQKRFEKKRTLRYLLIRVLFTCYKEFERTMRKGKITALIGRLIRLGPSSMKFNGPYHLNYALS